MSRFFALKRLLGVTQNVNVYSVNPALKAGLCCTAVMDIYVWHHSLLGLPDHEVKNVKPYTPKINSSLTCN